MTAHSSVEVSVDGVTANDFPSVGQTAALLATVDKLITRMTLARHIKLHNAGH